MTGDALPKDGLEIVVLGSGAFTPTRTPPAQILR